MDDELEPQELTLKKKNSVISNSRVKKEKNTAEDAYKMKFMKFDDYKSETASQMRFMSKIQRFGKGPVSGL